MVFLIRHATDGPLRPGIKRADEVVIRALMQLSIVSTRSELIMIALTVACSKVRQGK